MTAGTLAAIMGGVVHPRRGIVAAAIFSASLVMWLGVPPAWIWLLSRLGGSTGSYALVLAGLPASLLVWGMGLSRLDRVWSRLAMPERHPDDPAPSILGACLTASFLISLVLAVLFIVLVGVPNEGHNLGPFPG